METLGEIWSFVVRNDTVLWAAVLGVVGIWGGKKALALKVWETATFLNEERKKLAWKEAMEELDKAADEVPEKLEKWDNDLRWGEAKLMTLSSDKAKRAEGERLLNQLQKPEFID